MATRPSRKGRTKGRERTEGRGKGREEQKEGKGKGKEEEEEAAKEEEEEEEEVVEVSRRSPARLPRDSCKRRRTGREIGRGQIRGKAMEEKEEEEEKEEKEEEEEETEQEKIEEHEDERSGFPRAEQNEQNGCLKPYTAFAITNTMNLSNKP